MTKVHKSSTFHQHKLLTHQVINRNICRNLMPKSDVRLVYYSNLIKIHKNFFFPYQMQISFQIINSQIISPLTSIFTRQPDCNTSFLFHLFQPRRPESWRTVPELWYGSGHFERRPWWLKQCSKTSKFSLSDSSAAISWTAATSTQGILKKHLWLADWRDVNWKILIFQLNI